MAINPPEIQFIPVRLNTLRSDEAVGFDLYIQVGEKMLHYLRGEDPFDADRVNSLKSKGVRKLFIPLDSEPSYLRYLDVGINGLSDTATKLEERAEVAHDTLMNLSAGAERAVQSETRYQEMEGRVQKVLDFMKSEKNSALSMLRQSGVAGDDLQHASNVVTLSLMLASKLKITQPKELMDLSVAALMHDIGKVGLNLNFSVPREKLSPQELQVYKTHCERGVEKVRDKPFVSMEIKSLILNHEEMGDGAGFPEKKRIQTLPPTQQILNLCNEYDRTCTVFQLTPEQVMKKFFMERIGLFPLPLITALKEVLQING